MEAMEEMSKEELMKISVEEFSRLQKWMLSAKDKDTETYSFLLSFFMTGGATWAGMDIYYEKVPSARLFHDWRRHVGGAWGFPKELSLNNSIEKPVKRSYNSYSHSDLPDSNGKNNGLDWVPGVKFWSPKPKKGGIG